MTDIRQRFFIQDSPVRGDVVRLERSYASIIAQKDYPEAVKRLLGEMLTAASLLISTIKIEGRLSIQIQSSHESALLDWAMAECDHNGVIRGLASWKAESEEQRRYWQTHTEADDAFAQLGAPGEGVLFINIQPEHGEAYQGIVERSHDSLAACLAHYQRQSAQIPTLVSLASNGLQAGGILVQLLPRSSDEEQERVDTDLWPRMSMLTNTIKDEELTSLDANEILFRLYNEEDVVTPESTPLSFGCTCSREKCEAAIFQIGEAGAIEVCEEQGGAIEMDCGFCGTVYHFTQDEVAALFTE